MKQTICNNLHNLRQYIYPKTNIIKTQKVFYTQIFFVSAFGRRIFDTFQGRSQGNIYEKI